MIINTNKAKIVSDFVNKVAIGHQIVSTNSLLDLFNNLSNQIEWNNPNNPPYTEQEENNVELLFITDGVIVDVGFYDSECYPKWFYYNGVAYQKQVIGWCKIKIPIINKPT